MTPEEQMLISAVRYALGRMTYIVGETAEFVASIKDKISQKCIGIIIEDIEREIEFYHRAGQTCGMDYDERTWLRLKDFLKGDLNEQHL